MPVLGLDTIRHHSRIGLKLRSELKALPVLSIFLLFFLSGLAALIFQVLWMKELSLLFGNSAQAAAATLTAFFTGVAAGNAYWGRRASQLTRPLMTYGILELCVTLSALIYFVIYLAYDAIYPVLFNMFEYLPMVFTAAKFALALILLFPAAFFMGGTFPVMTQYFVRNPNSLGKRASLLYAINTLGAASGAIAAGFYLPQTLGIDASYVLSMSVTLLVGTIAVVLGRNKTANEVASIVEQGSSTLRENTDPTSPQIVTALAWISGFASLALQVLWIRMFAQVLHNSIYTYSVILSVFLIALAIGGALARQLAGRQGLAQWFLPSLLSLTALLVATSPILFYYLTNGGSYIGGDEGFFAYLIKVFSIVIVVIGIPTSLIGILLPYLFKLAEEARFGPGETVGRLVTVNTFGAILGSLAAGFMLLSWIGLWSSLKAIAMIYVVAAFWLLVDNSKPSAVSKLVPTVVLLLLVTVFDAGKLPIVKVDAAEKNEVLLKVWEGSDATVAVVRRDGELRTKLNNWYTLGGTADMATQQLQTHLPMLLHPQPKRIFYLGLGTGITAGTALNYEIDEMIVSEISPSAILASKEFFSDHTNGLYDDPRVTVIAEDGRNVLRGSRSTYDLIISDLFIPWKAGVGNLYSVDHYETAFKRLNVDGMYVQWLPLYQLTVDEFAIIARSMQKVFPRVTIWRGNFFGDRAVLALIGHQDDSHLSSSTRLINTSKLALRQMLNGQANRVPLIAHYAGTIRSEDARISEAELNTDSRPVIEYLAPINHRLEKAGQTRWFVGQQMLEFIGPYLNEDVLLSEPYLKDIDSAWHGAIKAGYYLQASFVLRDQNDENAAQARANYEASLLKAATELK